jgi:hypothetical protein
LKYEVDPLSNKEVTVKNPITLVDDKKYIFEV